MALPTPLARRQLRLAVVAALEAARLGATVDSPGDWNTPSEKLPAILVRCGDEEKTASAKTVASFTTTATIELSARVAAGTAIAAQDAIDLLGAAIEQAIFTNYTLMKMIQVIQRVQTASDITAEARQHIGSFKMRLFLETFEDFEPALQDSLAQVTLTADLAAPFSPTGTFTPSPDAPPYSPTTSPRTIGPDGRSEGALDIAIPE